MNMKEMKLLGETIQLSNDYVNIDTLKFLKDNPRVYAVTHGHPDFDNLIEEEQQDVIFKNLLKEPSVKNLIPDVQRHGGLIDPILIRHDTKEVIEGNSRLAVYRDLYRKEKKGEWEFIPCDIVSNLTDEQQAAFLNQIHVKGKTQWSAYEKANFAYVRTKQGWNEDKIAELFGESPGTIRTRIKVIEMMKDNHDSDRSHFSHYNVLVRVPAISKGMNDRDGLGSCLLEKIRNLGSDEDDSHFAAQDLRKKLPVILKKPKVLKKYIDGRIDLHEGYQHAKISHVEERIKGAKTLLEDVSKQEVSQLEKNELNAFKQAVRKLSREIQRIEKMVESSSND